jgi:hypothetical protein
MKYRKASWTSIMGFLVLTLCGAPAAGADFERKAVRAIQASGDGGDCFFVWLEGVNQPGSPSFGPWFAMSRTQYGAKDAYAMLLAAKFTGELVSVRSTTTGCGGYAMLNAVWMAP